MKTFVISFIVSLATFITLYFIVPVSFYDSVPNIFHTPSFGSTITTINGSDTLSASRTVINTNFSNLNTDKLESGNTAASLYITAASTTRLSCLNNCAFGSTATSSFSSAGVLSLASALTIANGGTNGTSFTTNSLAWFNGTSVVSTSTNPLYVSALIASSTSVSSNFLSNTGISSTTPWAQLAINPIAGQASNRFAVGSSTATSFLITNAGNVGVGTTSPWGRFTIDRQGTGVASSTIVCNEYRYGGSNEATSTAKTLDARTACTLHWPLGGSATTLTLDKMVPGQIMKVIIENPNQTAGAITWAAASGYELIWTGGSLPAQTTSANAMEIWSFFATQGSSTIAIIGAQSANAK